MTLPRLAIPFPLCLTVGRKAWMATETQVRRALCAAHY